MNSFVGIVTPGGLDVFVPETEHAVRFLMRRLQRWRATPAACFWAVMRGDHAARVVWALEQEHASLAWSILQTNARSVGRIVPTTPEDLFGDEISDRSVGCELRCRTSL